MRLFLTIISIICCLTTKAESYYIDISKYGEPFDGWGVSLCWWANMCGRWDDDNVEQLIDWLVSPEGLNYNIFRYNIGGGDDPENRNCESHHMEHGKGIRAEMQGFRNQKNAPYNWDSDAAQRRIMLLIKKKRPDAIFEAFSNSAPWWMTKSGCVGGNDPATSDNLRDDCYELFAEYLVDVCKYYHNHYGIDFATLEPFNEPVTNYWIKNGSQEGCHFSAVAQTDFIKVLYPILKTSGLQTKISASDETNVETSIGSLEIYKEKNVLPLIGQWNTHTYGGTKETKQKLQEMTSKLGIHLWQSETGDGGNGIQGNLKMAQRLIDDIRYLKPKAWLDWQYVEQWSDQWSLVTADTQWHTYTRHHNYYIRSMFSRFIHKGYRFVECTSENSIAAISPDKKELVIVALNTTSQKVTHNISIPKAKKIKAYRTSENENVLENKCFEHKNNNLNFTLPAYSIMTFIAKK